MVRCMRSVIVKESYQKNLFVSTSLQVIHFSSLYQTTVSALFVFCETLGCCRSKNDDRRTFHIRFFSVVLVGVAALFLEPLVSVCVGVVPSVSSTLSSSVSFF
jgi:hypothetical protein